jgi:hypothetical protein
MSTTSAFTTFGPGDPETWGPVTDHRDPRWDGFDYGPCDRCGEESTRMDQGVIRHLECEDRTCEMCGEPATHHSENAGEDVCEGHIDDDHPQDYHPIA